MHCQLFFKVVIFFRLPSTPYKHDLMELLPLDLFILFPLQVDHSFCLYRDIHFSVIFLYLFIMFVFNLHSFWTCSFLTLSLLVVQHIIPIYLHVSFDISIFTFKKMDKSMFLYIIKPDPHLPIYPVTLSLELYMFLCLISLSTILFYFLFHTSTVSFIPPSFLSQISH